MNFAHILEHNTKMLYQRFEFIGNTKDGKCHGFGIATHPDGRVFKGHWKDGVVEGYGILHDKGMSIEGNFINGLVHGYGIVRYGNGESYKGMFKAHRRHGLGVEVKCDGTKTMVLCRGDAVIKRFM